MTDWIQFSIKIGFLVAGFILAVVWDHYKEYSRWTGHRKAIIEELKENKNHLELSFNQLPSPIRQAITTAWNGGEVFLPNHDIEKYVAFTLRPELKTSAWDSVIALGLASRLLGNYSVVAHAYEKIRQANHAITSYVPLYELSLNPNNSDENRETFRQLSKMVVLSPELFCLPAIEIALKKIT